MGVPVFSGMRGGAQVLAGPTGGYLIGYLAAAAVTGALLAHNRARWMLPAAMAAGLVVCYAFGTAWYMVQGGVALVPALSMCVLPFLPGDALKIAAASLIAGRIGMLRFGESQTV